MRRVGIVTALCMSALAAVFAAGFSPVLGPDMLGPNPALDPDVATGPIIVYYDTFTVYVCPDSLLGANGVWDLADSDHSEWGTSAPDACIASDGINNFRAFQLRHDDPTASPGGLLAYQLTMSVDDTTRAINAAMRRCGLWVDTSFIPSGANLINAEICMIMSNTTTIANGGITAITSGAAGDSSWISAGQNEDYFVLDSSWNEANDLANEAWATDLSAGTGHYSSLGIPGPIDAVAIVQNDPVTLNVTEGTQHALDNDIEPFWWLSGHTTTAMRACSFYLDKPTANNHHTKQPFIKFTYTTARYDGPWPGGKTYAFVFTSDDQHGDNVDFYGPCFRDRNLRYQMFIVGEVVEGGDQGEYMTVAELQAEYALGGVDYGTHTYSHYTDAADGFFFGHILDPDTLGPELSTTWLAGITGQDSMNIISVAYPGCSWGDATVDYIFNNVPQLLGGRTCWTNVIPTWYADMDTADTDGGLYAINKRGDWDAVLQHGLDQGQVEAKADSVIATMQPGGLWTCLSHGTGTSTYAEADTAQIGFLLDHLISRGDVAIITFDEMLRCYRAMHTQDGLEWKWDY